MLISYYVTQAARAISHECCFCPEYHEFKCDFIQQFSKEELKKLILCYILNTILCVFALFCREHITFKATAELLCVSEQHSGV